MLRATQKVAVTLAGGCDTEVLEQCPVLDGKRVQIGHCFLTSLGVVHICNHVLLLENVIVGCLEGQDTLKMEVPLRALLSTLHLPIAILFQREADPSRSMAVDRACRQ